MCTKVLAVIGNESRRRRTFRVDICKHGPRIWTKSSRLSNFETEFRNYNNLKLVGTTIHDWEAFLETNSMTESFREFPIILTFRRPMAYRGKATILFCEEESNRIKKFFPEIKF